MTGGGRADGLWGLPRALLAVALVGVVLAGAVASPARAGVGPDGLTPSPDASPSMPPPASVTIPSDQSGQGPADHPGQVPTVPSEGSGGPPTPQPGPTSTSTEPAPVSSPAPVVDLDRTPDPVPEANPEDAADPPPADEAVLDDGRSTPPSPAPDVGDATAATSRSSSHEIEQLLRQIEADAPDARPDLLGGLLGAERQDLPWGHHDLGASVQTFEHLFSHQARLIFSAGMWAMAFATWLLDYVLQFELGLLLTDHTGAITMAYADFLRDEEGGGRLTALVYLIAVAHAGWQLLRHRGQAAVAELLVAVIIAVAGGYLMRNADVAGCVGLAVMADLTTGTVALTHPDGEPDTGASRASLCPEGPAAVIVALDDAAAASAARGAETPPDEEPEEVSSMIHGLIRETFVTEPFLLLQWGRVPDGSEDADEQEQICREVAEALISAGAWGDANTPRDHMGEAGCEDMVAFNRDMTVERVTGAAAYTATAWAFAAAVILTAGTLLVAQVAGVLLVVTMPFAVVLGIAPGAGREVLVRWGHAVLKVGVLFVGSAFFLALMLLAVSAVHRAPGEGSLFVRMLLSTAVAWSLVLLRGRLFRAMRQGSHSVARRVAGPGSDVGPEGVGPGRSAVAGVIRAADAATVLHGGARALKAGAPVAGAGSGSTAVVSPMTRGRGHALQRAHRLAIAPPIPAVGRSSPPAAAPRATRPLPGSPLPGSPLPGP